MSKLPSQRSLAQGLSAIRTATGRLSDRPSNLRILQIHRLVKTSLRWAANGKEKDETCVKRHSSQLTQKILFQLIVSGKKHAYSVFIFVCHFFICNLREWEYQVCPYEYASSSSNESKLKIRQPRIKDHLNLLMNFHFLPRVG